MRHASPRYRLPALLAAWRDMRLHRRVGCRFAVGADGPHPAIGSSSGRADADCIGHAQSTRGIFIFGSGDEVRGSSRTGDLMRRVRSPRML